MQNLRVLSISTRRPGPTSPPGPPCPIKIRRLVLADAPGYRALREHPEAFTSSFEEESERLSTDSALSLADTSPTNDRSWGKEHFFLRLATAPSARPA